MSRYAEMFPWNIAKSAEALSRYALKKVCKFVLKKKLGQFILGEIDLDQLDVQLAGGVIQLSDLALNVDYLNKLSQGSILKIREGSIRSVSVKMPWNDNGCEVEVDELELVLYPCCNVGSCGAVGTNDSNDNNCMGHDSEKGVDSEASNSTATLVDVHEGVKTVAKMVKRLLTSFHIRIKNVIVAFDFGGMKDGEKDGSHDTLVLRVTEIECGTCISDDNKSNGVKAEDLLGMTHLTNFLKFEGAVTEFLRMDSDSDQPVPTFVEETLYSSAKSSKQILSGKEGGFCGSVMVSIPWKNGSLDMQKVDAEIKVDPLIAILQPSTLKWLLATREILQSYGNKKIDSVYDMAVDTLLASDLLSDKKTLEIEDAIDFGSPLREETAANVFFKESRFMSDWVPFSTGNCQNEAFEQADLGASVDQFFECFDGMRSCHSVLGTSGMWGWTNSFFSAVTAASNLASGSLNFSGEQQHVQTNLKITLSGVSAYFCFLDEDELTQLGSIDDPVEISSKRHHLGLICKDIHVGVQVYPQDWRLEATIGHIVLNDYLRQKVDSSHFSLHDHVNGEVGQNLTFQVMQEKVQSALPFSLLFGKASEVEKSGASNNLDAPSSLVEVESGRCSRGVVTVTLFETFGASHCLLAASSGSFNGCSTELPFFQLKLPPFIFWLSSELVNTVLDILRESGNSHGKCKAKTDFSSEVCKEKYKSSDPCRERHGSNRDATSASHRGGLTGSIFLPHARIILCFPFTEDAGLRSYTSLNQFVALDFSSLSNSEKFKLEGSAFVREDTYLKHNSPSSSQSMHLNVANFDVYLIDGTAGGVCGGKPGSQTFRADKVLSFRNGTDWIRLVSMVWQEDAVTGAWIVKSAKHFTATDVQSSNMSSATSGCEFGTVFTRKETEDHSTLKQKLVFGSKFCLHVCAPSMVVMLSRSQYLCLFDLLNQVVDALSVVHTNADYENQVKLVSQTSFLVECAMVEFQIKLDQEDCPKTSLQRELPGSWHSLRLDVHNLQLLCVSDIGAVSGAQFMWLSHGEGKLLGSNTIGDDQDFALISCDNSSSGRGDGKGSNVLSCRPAGSDFVYMSDPESSNDFMTIILKCWTIIAPGGRLDWLERISSFFSLPSPEAGRGADCNSEKAESQQLSFVLKFIDGAISYEPHFGVTEVHEECLSSMSYVFVSFDEKPQESHVACLLAASSLTLSYTITAGSPDKNYGIRFQDVGLLLREVAAHETGLDEYSVATLHKVGYVKVAEEALADAILRVNYEDDVTWELYCSESHIVLHTCHDTTFGLIRLASQIQQLIAPDMEESLVHLQNRWNSFQHAQEASEDSSVCSCGASQVGEVVPDSKDKYALAGLMSEICEDAFPLYGNSVGPSEESQLLIVGRHEERPSSNDACSGKFLEGDQTSTLHKAEIMEDYCSSGLKSLSEVTVDSQYHQGILNSSLVSGGSVDPQRGNNGWYGRPPLKVVENYVTEINEQTSSKQYVRDQDYDKECSGCLRHNGRLHLQNVEVKWLMYGGCDWDQLGHGRDATVCLEILLSDMNIQYDIFPARDVCASKLCVSVQDLHLFDQSKDAPWKLVLGCYYSKGRPRESLSKVFKLDLEAVRPDPEIPLEEYRLHIAVLPVLLHLHQSQLDFLVAFFGNKSSPVEQQGDQQYWSQTDVTTGVEDYLKAAGIVEEALLPFFQKFDIMPIVVRVDYRPKHVDLAALSAGKYVELANLVPWKGVELKLKRVQSAGVYGWSNLCETAIGEWLEDISENQIHKILQGLPTVRSVVAVGSSAAKLVSLPVKSYRKDKRLVKGLQRGTIAFLRSISVEALGLGVHLAAGAHEILLHAECILGHIQPSVPKPVQSKIKMYRGPEQPQNAKHGLRKAYGSLGDGFEKSASVLIRAPLKAYHRGRGTGSALVTAVRGAPAAAVAPASAAAQALHCALVGFRNSLDPERKEESMNKYLGPFQSWKHS